MEHKSKQMNLFTEKDFEPREIEQAEHKEPQFIRDLSHIYESPIGFDCFYYMGSGTCFLHGDMSGCEDCEDYKSINDDEDDNEEDDEDDE